MLSLRTMMEREKARALSIDLGFRVGGDPFRAQIVDGRLEIERADPEGADLAFEGDPSLLASAFYGSQPLEEAEAAGLVRVTGDRALAQRFVDRSAEHTSELQSLMRISYAVFCLKNKTHNNTI